MTVTTIKLETTTKQALDNMKRSNETYDEVVRRVLKLDDRAELERRMIEGCKAERELYNEIHREWEPATSPWPD